MAFTMANVALRREIFLALGGFSRAYSSYGFEDKDFLVRLEQSSAKVVIRPDLTVSHEDDPSLDAVCRKASAAGRHSGPVFRRDHPDHYRRLPYAKCDARTGPLRLPDGIVPLVCCVTRKLARVSLAAPGLPFSLRRFLVRAAVCAAYFDGSRRSA
jgi:GT2 family glycosyltransferase